MSRSVTDSRLCFLADYYDELAALTREYQVLFYWADRTVELNDTKTRRSFLKRTLCNTLSKEQFFVGARVVIFGRVMKLKDYGDDVTKQLCQKINDDTIAVIGERAFSKLGMVLSTVNVECGFSVRDMHVVVATKKIVNEQFPQLPQHFINQRILVLHLVRGGALEKGQDLVNRIGPDCCWAAKDKEEVEVVKGLVEVAFYNSPALLGDEFEGISSTVVVKPHIIANGDGGDVLQYFLDDGLSVATLSQFTLSTHHADAFLNVYKGILEDYRDAVEHMASGPLWVVQLVDRGVAEATSAGAQALLRGAAKSASSASQNVALHVREVAGPFDPTLAKVLRPKTVRAQFGKDRVKNAVHVSDLVEDGGVDAEYFWHELQAL